MKPITIDYANEIFDDLMAGPETGQSPYAYTFDKRILHVKDWLLEKMNDNYLRWLGGMISDDEYKDTMGEYSDLASMISDNNWLISPRL